MATLLLDRNIEGTYLDFSTDFVRCCRCGIVTDIDVAAPGFDANIMVKALATAGMPQLNDAHPSISNCRVARHLIRGMANNQAGVQIFYESPQGGTIATQGTFFLKGSTALQTEAAGLDGDNLPLTVTYIPTGSGGTKINKHPSVNRHTALRSLQITGTVKGVPSASLSDCVGLVNKSPWQGLGIGFWMCNGFDFETNDLAETYSVSASFISRVYRDWKEYAIFVDESGNVPEDVFTGTGAKIVQAAMKAVYTKSQYNPSIGFTAIGFYGLTDFKRIFGF